METCLWCSASAESDVAVTRVLNRYCTDAMTPKEMQDANSDFIYCLECVVEYHRARERVRDLHKHLWKLETARLLKVFRDMLEADLEDSDLFFIDDEQEQPVSKFTPEEFLNGLRFPLMEVLKYPYLLCDRDLCEMVVNVLCKMEDMQNPLPVHDQYPGIYLLMVHPNEKVRHWAIATARSLGRVDRDNYYDLQEVFLCMFYIIDLGITVDFPNVDDSYCSGKLQMLPPHLYESKNKKNYWLGICMLLMQLDSQAMDSLLMGPEGQTSIPQCIINTMNDCNKDDPGSDPFWPALHCFLVVLDRLGSKIWGQIEPLDAFQAITKADSYIAEIKNIRQNTAGTRVKEETENHDDLLSCSQIVYDCYATERTSRSSNYSSGNSDTSGNAVFEEISCLVNVLQSEMGQGMRVYGSTFLWFIPFVRSIMELNVLNSICIGEVIHYLDNNADKDVLSGRTHTCDKVTEFFIRILVDIIQLHLSKGCMETLSYFTHIWVDLVMQCATLSGDIFHTRIQDGRGLYATSSHFGRGPRMPAVGVGAVSQDCMKLIRSLLKEGGPTATETAHFLDLVNKQMRSVSARGWNLPKSEYENLKKCLIKLVKAISERSAVLNDVLPSAPPTPPSENIVSYPNPTLTPPPQQVQTRDVEVGPSGPIGTIDFIKTEPQWDHGKCQSFDDGQEEMIKIKKEPCKPIQCSEFGSPPEVNYIKKIDLGKVQEIESGKIGDIAKKRFETEDEQGKYGDLKEFGHASGVSLQPSTSQSNISGSARFIKSSKRTLDDDDDDEPLDVRLRRLKRPVESRKENSTESRPVSIPLSSSAEKVDEAGVITTSDVSSNDKKLFENRVTRDPSFDLRTSPGRCYDDLSESQLFEYETEEDVASAWNEPDIDIPVVTKKQKLDSRACISHDAVEPMETQLVSDEDVERACLQVEAQICACGSMPEGEEPKDGNCNDDDDDDDDDEWTSLTQNEPTDMELCSQVEQMEVEYGENLYTVSHFGNRPDISKGETSVPLKPLSGNPPQKSLPDASTETSSNEHLFLKPSMPTECQKKTKPSTTKIYSSNSRSATLVKEMGKVANPPSAANVAKAKVARPPPPPKSTPQPEFRQPLPPRPSLSSLKPDLKSSLSSVTSASHVPSYKTYPRPEAPVSIQTPTVAQNRRPDDSPMYDPPYLKRAILKWEYHMFDNYRMFGTPKDLCPFPLKEVPTNFSSYQEYFNILYPLLLINTFEEMVREWLNGRKIRVELKVQAIEYHDRLASASFIVNLNAEQVKKQLYPREDDLVLLWLPENAGAYANDEPGFPELNIHFGCVVKSVLSNGGPVSTLYLTIQTRGNVSSVNTQPVRCEVIGSLISAVREFRALCLLQKSKMELPVLKPDIKYSTPCKDDLTNLDMPEYNRDQANAISCGVAMVKRKQNTPKVLLIHGPPGTGKSKIIVGMLHRLLSDGESPAGNRYAKSRRTRILLCAPSNAAIDNLMKKIIIPFKEKCLDKHAPQGNCGDINLVRLGSERTISEYLTPFSLDNQVRKRLEKAQQICDSDIQRKKEELDKQIEKLSQQCAETGKRSATFEQLNARKLKCLQDRERLGKQLKEFRSKRQLVQSRLLHDAHVICCTLSTSGSSLLEFAFRHLGHEPFNCVIVDETAKQLGYDQSLMARLCKTRLYPSIFLSFQYRMHPVICEFPSKYIYNNDLKSDGETARKLLSSSWPFEPYRVFDVIDGKERKEGDSFSNLKEVNLVLLLLKLLGEKHATRKEKQQIRIGIITPYNAQKQRLLQALKNDTDKEYKKCIQVEVDTVDGFQGREMDCIIVSCVRASNENGSIGFVANRQRMNVTITRAKFSLFILGHLCTLKQSEWGALIEDAKERGTVIEAHESNFHKVTRKVLKPIPFSHNQSYPPNIPASSGDLRMHMRPSDPRLAEAYRSSREQDGGNQSFTRPRPPSRRPSDPRFHQSSTRSFYAPPERRHDCHNSSSGVRVGSDRIPSSRFALCVTPDADAALDTWTLLLGSDGVRKSKACPTEQKR
ncbi:hypothetical protein AMELA_G00203080 [Ameiurus melas]|uniref:Helicase senataxin n=1 Tax=Ameiurus melas TaxID=219545 RepID=A0A7J6A2A0_AMEME|nr:hypothetical protein AMELA_G00203080 [Ameiurus melas]